MSFLRRVLGEYEGPANPANGPEDDFWYSSPGGTRTSSGEHITPEIAQTVSTFYRGVQIIAEGVAKLPCKVYRRLKPEGKEQAPDHPLADLFAFEPNQAQIAIEWFEMMTGHALMRGRAYSEIVPGRRGFADQLVPLDPRRVKPVPLPSGRTKYEYRLPDNTTRVYTQDEIFEFRGPWGMSLVQLMRESLGLARAAEALGAEQFGRQPVIAGFLTTEGGAVVDPDTKGELSESLRKKHSGRNNRFKIPVLTGMKWQEIGMSLQDAQFLETRKFQREEIATFLGVPPHKLGIPDDGRVSSIEQQNVQFLNDCLMPWLVRWEQFILKDLILDRKQYFAQFLLDALLRATTKDRYEAHKIATGGRAWMSPDEVRVLETMNPMGGELAIVREGLGTTRVDDPPGGEPPAEPKPADPKKNGKHAAAPRRGARLGAGT